MKKKDITYLILAVVIFLGSGYVAYTQLVAKKPGTAGSAKAGVQVEVIGSIPESLDGNAVAQLNDPSQVKDFNLSVDLTGLGSQAPFGQ